MIVCIALRVQCRRSAPPCATFFKSKGPTISHAFTNCPNMKFLQVAIFATVLVASAHAIACNTGSAANVCPSVNIAGVDTCTKCVIKQGGQTAVVSGGCVTGPSCDAAKTSCSNLQGTYTTCTSGDNCNGCSPASALQLSVFLLLAALSAMFF